MSTDILAQGLAISGAKANSKRIDELSGFGVNIMSRAFVPNGFVNLNGYTFQRQVVLCSACRSIRFVYRNMVQGGTPNENSIGPYTVQAEIIFNFVGVTGMPIPITFNGGQTTVTIPAYGTAISDPMVVPGLVASFPSQHFVRSLVTMSGAYLPVDNQILSQITSPPYYEGYLSGDYVSSNSMQNTFGGSNQSYTFGPSAILGSPTIPSTAIYVAGDSIPAATGWVGGQPGTQDGWGFANYFGSQNNIPIINTSRGGETLATALSVSPYTGTQQRLQMAVYNTVVIDEYGTNDIGILGTSLATLKSEMLMYWGWLSRMGLSVFKTTILPRTNSTDQWQTTANQTTYGGSAQELVRQGINAWLRAPSSAGAGNSARYDAGSTLTGILDTAAATEANVDGSRISVNANTGAISNGSGGYWWVDTTTYVSGTASSWNNSQQMNDTTKTWTANQWWGYTLLVTSDSTTPGAVGQAQDIAVNTITTIGANVFTTQPDSGSGYRIYRRPTIDGIHPSTWNHQLMAGVLTSAYTAGTLK